MEASTVKNHSRDIKKSVTKLKKVSSPAWRAHSHQHLAYYLDEYAFRCNRRTSSYRGKLFYRLLQNAVVIDPVRYSDMTMDVRGQWSMNKI